VRRRERARERGRERARERESEQRKEAIEMEGMRGKIDSKGKQKQGDRGHGKGKKGRAKDARLVREQGRKCEIATITTS